MLKNIVQNQSVHRQLIFLAIDIVWKINSIKDSSLNVTTDERLNKLISLADNFTDILYKEVLPKASRKGA